MKYNAIFLLTLIMLINVKLSAAELTIETPSGLLIGQSSIREIKTMFSDDKGRLVLNGQYFTGSGLCIITQKFATEKGLNLISLGQVLAQNQADIWCQVEDLNTNFAKKVVIKYKNLQTD
jgi:hypothetical protein